MTFSPRAESTNVTRWITLSDDQVTAESVEQYLNPITDDLWVVTACVDRILQDTTLEQTLLELGITRTEQALKRSRAVYESPSPGDVVVDEEEEEKEQVEGKEKLTVLESYFRDEPTDARLCEMRATLLERLDRLATFVEICKSQGASESTGNEEDEEWLDSPWAEVESSPSPDTSSVLPLSCTTFLTGSLLDTACLLASNECFTAVHTVLERHGPELWPHRFAILQCIPEHTPIVDFRDLLPGVDSSLSLERMPDFKPRRTERDWSEETIVQAALSNPKFARSAPPCNYSSTHMFHPSPLSSDELKDWYRERMDCTITATGMADNALSLAQHAASLGVPGLDEVGEDLLLLCRLLYDTSLADDPVAIEDDQAIWTLDRWNSLDSSTVIHAYLAHSTPENIARDITRLVMPYLFVLESRAERAGHPEPELPKRLLYDYILNAPLNIVASVFEASKPTLPPAQRILRSDEDMIRLALACLYGCESVDQWSTMSRIFECLPAWDLQGEQDDQDDSEVDTTIASLSAYVVPSTTGSQSTASDLLLFFKPLSLSSLSRVLDVLDVHLESGEILARWSVPAPLRWFLLSNANESEQRAWANRMARRAGGADDKLETRGDWEWLLEDMLKLSMSDNGDLKTAFCLLSKDEIVRIFFTGLLSSGQFDLARGMLKSSEDLALLSPEDIEAICLTCSQEFYDNSSSGNYHFGDMKLAYDCLNVPLLSERIVMEKDFIEATSRLCTFNLMSRPGIPISPLEIRLTKDRLSLISRVLASNSDAYKHTQVIVELAHKLGFKSDPVAEVKTLAMLTDTALHAEDFDRAYETSEKMIKAVLELRETRPEDDTEMQQAAEVCWVSSYQLARHPEFDDVKKKSILFGRTMELCPPNKLADIVGSWRRSEDEDLDRRRAKLADRHSTATRRPGTHLPHKHQAKAGFKTSSLTERLHHLHMPSSPLVSAPDAAALANKAFHTVTANFPFSVGGRNRALAPERPGSAASRYDGAEVSAHASRALQKGLGWLLGDDD
ncbi:hypothetical protein PHLCEN_2v8821 [Hermanssonia centrifuga]|uniref:Sec39 domain-containing protein n=1 Tax=Hermanssonia centrifuga TaxID=98765 RepID=A0A2R6NSP0_9APHY|nr:hypothetical protein PHLCEN_2v8821 [Hermanssonia centrifuga]